MGSEGEMNRVVKEIRALRRGAIAIKCDVTNAQDVESMVRRVVDEFDRIDILVNNAGIAFAQTPVWEVDEETWDLTVDIMLKGTYLCSKYVLPHMIEQQYGKIVNASSIAARAQRYNAPYSAVKAAIEVLTLSMAKDAGEYNVNVNCVAPGGVRTPMVMGVFKDAIRDSGLSEDEFYAAACKQFSILGREITEEDISDAVLFLCSEKARNVNGQVLYVDGGFLRM
jgi:3-oxoacyl-[acyl-carrier protein] reductase